MNSIPRPIRLCYIIDNLSFRGGERTFAQLALGLDRAKYDIHVICSPGGHFVELLQGAGIPVFPVDMRNKWNLGAVLPMAGYLRRSHFDIVHTQGRGDPFGRLAARLAGIPLLISTTAAIVSRYWGAGPSRRLLYRAIDLVTDPLVDHWIVVNHASVDTLVQDHWVPRERVSVILNGIEPEQYAPDPAERAAWRARRQVGETELAVGAIGSLTWEKGFEHLLRDWLRVRAAVPQARLFVLGAGELEANLKKLAAGLGINHACTFTGFEPDVPAALAGLDLFVLSSLAEGLPMILLEAMAAGKPVIATRIDGCLEVVTDGVDGLLVEPGQPDALATALIQLLQSPERAKQLSLAARQTVRQRFTVERVIQETQMVYQQLLDRRYSPMRRR